MTANWLYPLSRTSRAHFQDVNGQDLPDTCFGCFLHMHTSGVTDNHWYVSKHASDVKKGDHLWACCGKADGDRGIVALAEILGTKAHPDGTPGVLLKWRRNKTSKLLDHPFPAAEVRLYIQYPRAAVMALDDHPQLVAAINHHLARLS